MQITIQIDDEFVKKIDNIAKKLGLSRSQLSRNLMMNGYEDMMLLEKVGAFDAVVFGRKILSKFKEGVLKGDIRLDEEGELTVKK